MSDNGAKDELRNRFNTAHSEDNPDNASETDTNSQPSHSSQASQTDEPNEGNESLKTDRKQVAMYLPKHLRDDLTGFYDELDARSTLADGTGIEKNREFYETLVRFVLDRRVEFAEQLGVDIDD